jgi:polynucleotide 5'-hydroxyl-kinase GRC3/NOL9
VPPLNWDKVPPSGNAWRIHHLEAIPPSAIANKYAPADYRNLSILSYFHAIFPTLSHRGALFRQVTATLWDTSSSLCARAPYEVNWSVALDKVILTGSGTEDIVRSEVGRVLKGAVVGLVASEHESIDTMRLPSGLSTDTNDSHPLLRYAPDPPTSICHGLALIRSLSSTGPILHVLTPLPVHLLASCRVIVKGELELPVWGMLDHTTENGSIAGVEGSMVPYLQWGKGEGLGADKRRVRNLMYFFAERGGGRLRQRNKWQGTGFTDKWQNRSRRRPNHHIQNSIPLINHSVPYEQYTRYDQISWR